MALPEPLALGALDDPDVFGKPHIPPSAHILPTICPQLQISLVVHRDVFLQVRPFSTPDHIAGSNHHFFCGSGSSHVIAKAVITKDDDWDF